MKSGSGARAEIKRRCSVSFDCSKGVFPMETDEKKSASVDLKNVSGALIPPILRNSTAAGR